MKKRIYSAEYEVNGKLYVFDFKARDDKMAKKMIGLKSVHDRKLSKIPRHGNSVIPIWSAKGSI